MFVARGGWEVKGRKEKLVGTNNGEWVKKEKSECVGNGKRSTYLGLFPIWLTQ